MVRKDEEDLPDGEIPREPAINEQPQEESDPEAEGPEGSNVTKWDGMRVVGHARYGLKNWDEEHPFEGLDFTKNKLV